MPRHPLSPDKVLEVINQLASEGIDVSVTSVRQRLGTGSYTTIGAVLSEWRRTNEASAAGTIPDPPSSLRPLALRIWGEAWRAAHAAHEVERGQLGQERSALLKDREEMTAEITRLEQEVARSAEAADRTRADAEAIKLKRSKLLQANELLGTELERVRGEAQRAADQLALWVERATRAETLLSAREQPQQALAQSGPVDQTATLGAGKEQ